MLSKAMIVRKIREAYPYLAAEYGVKRIGLFGSYARNAATETSDVDLVVEFERPVGFKFIELGEYLEQLLGQSVDVLTPVGIHKIRVPGVEQEIEADIVYV